jgi:nicotinate phosphoribosyltransferase
VRVTAPIIQAQFIESRLINLMHYQVCVASKAVRCSMMAPGKQLVDFGFRRAHGSEAGVLASRAAMIGGFHATATVEAGRQFGIPVIGTMAHSFIQCHGNEYQAFADFAQTFPENVILLIDTYDTIKGAQNAIKLAKQLAENNIILKGVRIDSGDLIVTSKQVRAMFDEAGLNKTIIFASGNLDEYGVQKLSQSNAPIDGYGIGTHLTTSNDAPTCDMVYKLQEYAGVARRKLSPGKATWPGQKQVFRHTENGKWKKDIIALADEKCDGDALLVPVMKKGLRQGKVETLHQMQQRLFADLKHLPAEFCSLEKNENSFPVQISDGLNAMTEDVNQKIF